jgi:hypothetical protein
MFGNQIYRLVLMRKSSFDCGALLQMTANLDYFLGLNNEKLSTGKRLL